MYQLSVSSTKRPERSWDSLIQRVPVAPIGVEWPAHAADLNSFKYWS